MKAGTPEGETTRDDEGSTQAARRHDCSRLDANCVDKHKGKISRKKKIRISPQITRHRKRKHEHDLEQHLNLGPVMWIRHGRNHRRATMTRHIYMRVGACSLTADLPGTDSHRSCPLQEALVLLAALRVFTFTRGRHSKAQYTLVDAQNNPFGYYSLRKVNTKKERKGDEDGSQEDIVLGSTLGSILIPSQRYRIQLNIRFLVMAILLAL